MEEILNELRITDSGEDTKNGAYEITLKDSNAYGKYYSLLDRNDNVEQMEDNALLTLNEGRLLFVYKDYLLDLQGDFTHNIYRLVISKK